MNNEEVIAVLNHIMRINAVYGENIDEFGRNLQGLNMAIKALEKQIPKKPVNGWYCPICNEKALLGDYYNVNYCNSCGQKLDWSE